MARNATQKEVDRKMVAEFERYIAGRERRIAAGAKGGRARARKLSKRKKSEIGRKGARARWGK